MSLKRETILKYRRLLKIFGEDLEKFPEDFQTDQQKNVPNPPLQKSYPVDVTIVDLVNIEKIKCGKEARLYDVLKRRRSHRSYTEESLTLEEFSFLLWSTQGVHEVTKHHGSGTRRVVPSGGARHPFETYLIVNRVDGLKPGFYRYLAIEHQLLLIKDMEKVDKDQVNQIAHQGFIPKAAVIFIWAVIPYRMEWRYSITSYRAIAIEAGHICQNLYLACGALNLGTCAIAAYNQEICDGLFDLDGKDEFTMYLAPVGRL
ncbi:MAG: SagB/ThcOx family dehydrogenase [Candidatus Hodarchaeota archaeon]